MIKSVHMENLPKNMEVQKKYTKKLFAILE